MEEYPRDLSGFEAWFATEQACRDYLFRLRWPEGFRCPRCDGDQYWPVRLILLEWRKCGHQTSVTAGTIFQDTRKPLVDWFRAMYWVTNAEDRCQRPGAANGPRAGELQDRLDLAPQATSSDGPAPPRPSVGSGRGWRKGVGGLGGGSARPAGGAQVLDCHRGPRRWSGHRADPHEANSGCVRE